MSYCPECASKLFPFDKASLIKHGVCSYCTTYNPKYREERKMENEKKPYKPILCFDFDGVIHSYESGWKGADTIPDPPVEGAIDFLKQCLEHFEVHIFSARSGQQGGISAMKDFINEHGGWNLMTAIKWPLEKPPAFLTIDDRVHLFTGLFPSIQEIKDFKPWNKK